MKQPIKIKRDLLRESRLALLISLSAVASSGAYAVSFPISDGLDLSVSTTLNAGVIWSTSDPDRHLLTKADSVKNGGKGNGINYNADDGRLNFKKGDVVSKVINGITDIELQGNNYGGLMRVKYWRDLELYDHNLRYNKPDDSGWQRSARFSGVDLLDAYLWKDLNFLDKEMTVRLGKHALLWGESLFIQNGINTINPVDVSAFNRPGVELKEGLLPVEMLSFNASITDSFGIEGFWQIKQRETIFDGCGTFFSIADNFQEGCATDFMIAGGLGTTADAINGERYLPRSKTRYAKNTGQYGVALNFMLPEEFNHTELGVYFSNYHSRNPFVSGIIASDAPFAPGNLGVNLNTGKYFTEYPEDIRLYGLSLSSVVGGLATFGELSYRPNMPVSYNGADLVALLVGTTTTSILNVASIDAYRGTEVRGYKRMPVWQMTLGMTGTFSNVLAANSLIVAAEAGANYIQRMDKGEERFGRSGSFGRTTPTDGSMCTAIGTGGLTAVEIERYNMRNCNTEGLHTRHSYGVRSRMALNYESLVSGFIFTPAVSLRYDIKGNGINFQQNQKAIGLSFAAQYNNKYSIDFSYNNFFGSNKYSVINDRDFASINLKVDF